MQVDAWLTRGWLWSVSFWQGLSPENLYDLWLYGGVVWFLFLFWLCYGIMRRALGHVKFRGTWYSDQQWETVIKMIDEDNQRGHRVMRKDEMDALRMWRYGSSKSISGGAKGYF